MDGRKNARELESQKDQNIRAEQGPDTLHKRKERLYEKISRRVSVAAMDKIIWVVAGLIVLLLIVGIVTGNQ